MNDCMLTDIKNLLKEIQKISISSQKELENYKAKYLSKKGKINSLFQNFKNVPDDHKKETGKKLNELKNISIDIYQIFKEKLEFLDQEVIKQDLSLPGYTYEIGSRHPVSIVRNEIIDIFKSIFLLITSPQIYQRLNLSASFYFL